MSESGKFYGTLIDPILKPMRARVAKYVNPGDRVIDIACGTGAQVFEIAEIADLVVGIDLSDSMLEFAKRSTQKKTTPNVQFYNGDAGNLSDFRDGEFDVATMSLALHQFNPQLHGIILSEMKRVASKIIIVDYSVPLPKNYAGLGSRIAEIFAGKEHYKYFKLYNKLGGLDIILKNNDLIIEASQKFGKGAFHLVVCQRSATDSSREGEKG